MNLSRNLIGALGALGVAALVPLETSALPVAGPPEASELGKCPPQWPTHCPHSLPVEGDCFARGVSCKSLRHCPPEKFARACPPGKQVVCWSRPKGGNYGDCQ